jgi:hypothetical protein
LTYNSPFCIVNSSQSEFLSVSVNQEKTWTIPYPAAPVETRAINEIDVDPVNPDRIYVASDSGFHIYDGKKWIKKVEENGLSRDSFGLMSLKCVVVHPRHPEVL